MMVLEYDQRVIECLVWTLYQVFEELGFQWRTFIHLNCHHLYLSRTLKLQNLGMYTHKKVATVTCHMMVLEYDQRVIKCCMDPI